jgi:hypothetical protein
MKIRPRVKRARAKTHTIINLSNDPLPSAGGEAAEPGSYAEAGSLRSRFANPAAPGSTRQLTQPVHRKGGWHHGR